jgi:hypothetical protein
MTSRRRWLAGLAAIALALVTAATAFGYAGEVAGSVTVTGPTGKLKCGVVYTLSAVIRDAAGKRIAGQPVAWKLLSTPSTKDKLRPLSKATGSNGVAKAQIKMACVPGSRRVAATADGVQGTLVLNLTAGGLPNTSTLPAEAPASPFAPMGALFATLAVAVGGAFVLRQLALDRR